MIWVCFGPTNPNNVLMSMGTDEGWAAILAGYNPDAIYFFAELTVD